MYSSDIGKRFAHSTGVHERLVLGQSPELTEEEHLARYRFAIDLVFGRRVADIACGTGYGATMLAENGAKEVLGMDISEEALLAAREHCPHPRVSFAIADAQNLTSMQDGAFDVVVSFETIEHLNNVRAYIGEMARILRPGGKFVVSTPDRRLASVMHCFRGRPSNPHHLREYTERELLDVLTSRFDIETICGQSFVPSWLVLWPIQVMVRGACRILGSPKILAFKDSIYSNWGNVEVIPKTSASGIPKFWVIVCSRPETSATI